MFTPVMFFAPNVAFTMPTTSLLSDIVASNAVCQFQLRTDGHEWGTTLNNTVNDLGAFINPTSAVGNYEVMTDTYSGAAFALDPSAGSWIALTSNRTWQVTRTTVGTNTKTFTVHIRPSGGSEVFSVAMTMTAIREP